MSGLEGLLAGHTLSERYRIEEVIGRGGFAAVYRARDERLGRTVALKVITLGSADADTRDTIRRRFAREATVAASLHHVNVVTVFDVGTDPRLDLDFLVMELLHGEDLARRLSRGEPFAPRTAVRLLRDAAWGLAAGHRSGLIHRDVKPANIFLAEQERTDRFRVCILDFGIAQIRSSENSLTRLTRGGAPLSPPYAAPEQLREERDLSPAADVYGLGVIAYQLFAGERPYGPDQIQGMIRGEPPPLPRFEGLALPAGLEAAVRRALAPDPERRFADAGELAEELDAAYDALRVDDRPAEPAGGPVAVAVPVAGRPREAAPPAGAAPATRPAPEPIASRVSRLESRPAPPPPAAAPASPPVVPPAPVAGPPSPPAPAPEVAPPSPAAVATPRETASAPPPPATRTAGERGAAEGHDTARSTRRALSGRRLAVPLVFLLAALGGWWALSRGRTTEPRLAGDPGARPGSSPATTGAGGPAATQPRVTTPGAQPAGTAPAGTQPGGPGGAAPSPGTVAGPGTPATSGSGPTAGAATPAGGTSTPGGAPAAGRAPAGGSGPAAVPATRPGTAPVAGRAPSRGGGTTPAAGTPRPVPPGASRPGTPAPRPAPRPEAPAPRRTPSLVARGSAVEHNRAAERLFDRRNYAGAVAGFRRAVAAAPGNSYYRNNLGWALYMAGDLEGAERELRATVRMDPRRAIAYANLGEVRWARGDAEGAVANYRRFLELNTDPRRERIATEKLRRMGATP